MRIYRMALVVGTFSLAWGGDLHQKGLNVLVVDQTGVPSAMLQTASLTAQAIFQKGGNPNGVAAVRRPQSETLRSE